MASIIKNDSNAIKNLNLMLRTIRDNNLGPTYATRFLYLGSTIIHYAVGLSVGKSSVNEPLLKKDKDLKPKHVQTVIYHGFKYLYGLLNYPFDQPELRTKNSNAKKAIKCIKNFLNERDLDGWKLANDFATEDYPNPEQFIDVDAEQDLSALQPHKWTPLKYNDNVQNYLTPKWGQVVPLIDIAPMLAIADTNYNENRDGEIQEMLNIYANMNDYHRTVAEYFQGGQVTPPGIWNVWLIYTSIAVQSTELLFSKVLYDLNRALFTAGIVAWNVKFNKLQSRPIQYIRLLSPEREVTTWDGTKVSNKIWNTFQQSNGRSPPFPDYISGHSTFSGAASVIFNKYFPKSFAEINFAPFSAEHAQMISPLINNNLGNTVKEIKCNAGSSTVDQGNSALPFPICATVLNFTSWNNLAELSGKSRIYGGIHCESANGIGIIIGEELCKKIV